MSQPTVDSTDYISLTDIKDTPLITVCPKQEIYTYGLSELGYYGLEDFMLGKY